MKKTIKFLSALTSVTLFSSAVIMPASAEETTYDTRDNEACYSISFIDEVTNKRVENVQAKLCKIETKYLSGQITPSGELSVIDEWNSSDESTYTTEWYPAEDDYAYIVIVDELPDGYTYAQESGLLTRLDSSYQTGKVDFDIWLKRGEPDIPRDYPLNGTFSLDIAIKDMYSGNIVKGVECELINEQTGDVISAWNTSEQEKMHFETLEYKFNTRITQETGSETYAVRIKNMPEGYKVYPRYANGENGITIQRIGYSMFYIYHNNNELSYTVPLVKSEDVPIVTTTADTEETDINESEPQTFHCPDCGRDVPISERVSGPLRSICRDCYEAGHYIGTTAPIHYNDTTTTAVSSDTEPANQTNSTTVTTPTLNADIVFKDEAISLEIGEEKAFEYTVTGADTVSFYANGSFKVVDNTYSNGKGIVTLKASRFSYANSLICTLRSGESFTEKIIPVNITEPTTFICPKCGKEKPVSERIDGPYWWICKECYEAQPIGSTIPPATDITTTSTTTVTIDPSSTTVSGKLGGSGDVNLDGQTTVADAVAILQFIGNRDKYPLTSQGLKNADVDGIAGVTASDALFIQKVDAGLLDASQLKTQ